ncbi:ATP-binding protein [Embleya sp. NPDC059237]|uniref:ATP-binding protein n=1 Tax=Embleya sp. NPDC059237 TaxID=3346784 RepID=UPI0036C308ED
MSKPQTVSTARAHVRRFCERVGFESDDPVRVTSELASNAVEHAGDYGDYEVSASLHGRMLWVEVLDHLPCSLPSPVEVLEDAEAGRGLLVVAALTQRFRVELRSGGRKAVCAGFEEDFGEDYGADFEDDFGDEVEDDAGDDFGEV